MIYESTTCGRIYGLVRDSRHPRSVRLHGQPRREEPMEMNDLKPNGKLDVRELNRRLHRLHLFMSDGNLPAARALLEKTIAEIEQPNPIKK